MGAIEVGSSKLVDLVSQGAQKVKTAWQTYHSEPTTTAVDDTLVEQEDDLASVFKQRVSTMMDTHDEDLFRGLYVEELKQTRTPTGATKSTWVRAATVDADAPRVQHVDTYRSPQMAKEAVRDAFIRNHFVENVNEVEEFEEEDEDEDDEDEDTMADSTYVEHAFLNDDYVTAEEYDDGGIEVEVLEGIRRPTSASRNVAVDAEILDKTFMY